MGTRIRWSPKVELVCPTCKAVFWKYPSQCEGSRVFCSAACRRIGLRKHPDSKCAWCNKTYRPPDRSADSKFCSRGCYLNYIHSRLQKSSYKKSEGRHEHRVVAERILGRKLSSLEVIHHIDDNKHNNEPWNLALVDHSLHAMIHLRKNNKIPDCVIRGWALSLRPLEDDYVSI